MNDNELDKLKQEYFEEKLKNSKLKVNEFLKDKGDYFNGSGELKEEIQKKTKYWNSNFYDEFLKKEIRKNKYYEFGEKYYNNNDNNLTVRKQLIRHGSFFYRINTVKPKDEKKEGKKEGKIIITKVTSFDIQPHLDIYNIDNERIVCTLEIKVITGNTGDNDVTMIELEGLSKVRGSQFEEKINEKKTLFSVLSNIEVKQILYKCLDKSDILYRFATSGLIDIDQKGKNHFLYKNALFKLGNETPCKDENNNGMIEMSNKEDKKKKFISSSLTGALPIYKSSNNPVKNIADELINNLIETYSGLNGLTVVSTAIMVLYRDLFLNLDSPGFPIPFLYGESQAGKSSLSYIINSLYGLPQSFSIAGNSTILSILEDMSKYNIPLTINEFQQKDNADVEMLMKNLYEGITRQRLAKSQDKNNAILKELIKVNTTGIFISNHLPPLKDQVLNRLQLTKFLKGDFSVESAKSFNEIKKNDLPSLLPHIFKNSDNEIEEIYKKEKIKIENNLSDKTIDYRILHNYSISFTGIEVFSKIANCEGKYDDRKIEYLENILNSEQSENYFDLFLDCLPNLHRDNGKIDQRKDYIVEKKDGKIFMFIKLTKESHILKEFKKLYKRTEGGEAPSFTEIKDSMLQHKLFIAGTGTGGRHQRNFDDNTKKVNCYKINITEKEGLSELVY